jgi:hypothetical protein
LTRAQAGRGIAAFLIFVILSASAASCGGGAQALPEPGAPSAVPPPDLAGADVMVLPAQAPPGAAGVVEPVPGLDGEIAFWFAEMGPRTRWVFPPEIDRALARSPSLTIRPRALAVSNFHVAEVKNIGDPLFGDLRALNALLGARLALVPVSAEYAPAASGPGRVEIRAALIDTLGGAVLWFGAVAGDPGRVDDPAVAASAARALARAVLRQ